MKLADIAPTLDRVLIRKVAVADTAKSALAIPDTVRASEKGVKCVVGQIVAVGPGKVGPDGALIPMRFSPGQIVFIDKFAGGVIEVVDDERRTIELQAVEQDSILAAVK